MFVARLMSNSSPIDPRVETTRMLDLRQVCKAGYNRSRTVQPQQFQNVPILRADREKPQWTGRTIRTAPTPELVNMFAAPCLRHRFRSSLPLP